MALVHQEAEKINIMMSGRTDVEIEPVEGKEQINFVLDNGNGATHAWMDLEDMLELATELLVMRRRIIDDRNRSVRV